MHMCTCVCLCVCVYVEKTKNQTSTQWRTVEACLLLVTYDHGFTYESWLKEPACGSYHIFTQYSLASMAVATLAIFSSLSLTALTSLSSLGHPSQLSC